MRTGIFLLTIVLLLSLLTLATLAEEANYFDPSTNTADDTHPFDKGVLPVTWASFRLRPDFEKSFSGALYDGTDASMPRGEVEAWVQAYIGERYRDSQVAAEGWLETYNLFSAARFLARRQEDDKKSRRLWLEVALSAAERILEIDAQNTRLSFDVGIMFEDESWKKDGAWFCDRLIESYKQKLQGPPSERAIALFNISELQKAKGDDASAKESLASAHSLFPKDIVIARKLKNLQIELGDYEGALHTLKTIGWRLSPEDEEALHGEGAAMGFALDAGDMYLRLGDYENAQEALLLSWKLLWLIDAEHEGYVDKVADDLNRCATCLGLTALATGDLEKAIKWFKESFTASRYIHADEYDLRLVKELMEDPALHGLCVMYLQMVMGARAGENEAAKALLAQLTGDQTAAKARGAAPSGKADESVPGGMTSQKTDPQRTQTQAGPRNSQKKRKTTGAVVAVIIAAVVAAVYANRRKKARGERNDI